MKATKITMAYPLPNYKMLNFRRQSAAKFNTSTRANPTTGKQETYHNIQNDAGYAYKVVTPPCETLFPHLCEGGNEGGKFSKTKESASIVTNLLRGGEDKQFQSERDDFFTWLANMNDSILDQMYDEDIGGASTAVRAKTKKRYSKNKTPEELEVMSRKAFKKSAMVPLKTMNGEEQLVTKCKAYTNDLAPREIRYVQTSGDKYIEMEETPTIRGGALVSTVFSIRPFTMAKDKYGLTYKLIPDVVVYSTGRGRSAAPMDAIETPGREYTMSVSEGKEGKLYLNINDSENRKFEFRPVATEVVFGDSLTGTGTLGNIAGVTESSARYSAVTKEDPENPESVALFDYISKMADDVFAFALADDRLLTKLKADSKEEAEEMAEETGQPYEECFQTVIRESFKSPVTKREQDEYRQLRFSQHVYSRTGTQNQLPVKDADGLSIEGSIRRGAMIAPVLQPGVTFMADGKFGMKLDISLQHGIRVDSNPEATDDSGGVLYAFKRAVDDANDEPSAKRPRIMTE